MSCLISSSGFSARRATRASEDGGECFAPCIWYPKSSKSAPGNTSDLSGELLKKSPGRLREGPQNQRNFNDYFWQFQTYFRASPWPMESKSYDTIFIFPVILETYTFDSWKFEKSEFLMPMSPIISKSRFSARRATRATEDGGEGFAPLIQYPNLSKRSTGSTRPL